MKKGYSGNKAAGKEADYKMTKVKGDREVAASGGPGDAYNARMFSKGAAKKTFNTAKKR